MKTTEQKISLLDAFTIESAMLGSEKSGMLTAREKYQIMLRLSHAAAKGKRARRIELNQQHKQEGR